jgi:hypothetical protein
MERTAIADDVWLARRMTLGEMSVCLERCLDRDHSGCSVDTCDRYRQLVHWQLVHRQFALAAAQRDAVPHCESRGHRQHGAAEQLRGWFIVLLKNETIELTPADRERVETRLRHDREG